MVAEKEVFLSPVEIFKRNILELSKKIIELDISGDKKGYVTGVKHLYRYMIKYIPRSVNNEIKALLNELSERIDGVKKKNLTDVQKEKQIQNLQYQYYDRISEYVIKVLSHSPIVEEEIVGILTNIKTLDDVEKLRNNIVKKEEKIEVFGGLHGNEDR